MASGAATAPSEMAAATAEATDTPCMRPSRSPVAYTVVAPWSPISAAQAVPSVPQNTSTVPATSRALASISRVMVATPSAPPSQYTQILSIAIAGPPISP